MDCEYYFAFFHDGGVTDIRHDKSCVNFDAYSSEILPDENRDGIQLDDEGCISGTLRVIGAKQILVNDSRFEGQLDLPEGCATLLDLEVRRGLLDIGILCHGVSGSNRYRFIQTTAEQIIWHDRSTGQQTDVTSLNTGFSNLTAWKTDIIRYINALSQLPDKTGAVAKATPGLAGSYQEVMRRLYSDDRFDDFMDRLAKDSKPEIWKAFSDFKTTLDVFAAAHPPDQGEQALDNSNWPQVQQAAKKLLASLDRRRNA